MNSVNTNIQLRDFYVRLLSGQTINEPIENIRELDQIIRIYGRNIISSITFYFYDSDHPDHYIILRNTRQNDKFIVEFYHYYDQYHQCVELTREKKLYDFECLINCLRNQQNISRHLLRFTIDPFNIATIMT
jgi:hypothetical protein